VYKHIYIYIYIYIYILCGISAPLREREREREVEKGGDMGVYIGRWKQEGSKKEGKDGKEG
jgi:hypothetical protein